MELEGGCAGDPNVGRGDALDGPDITPEMPMSLECSGLEFSSDAVAVSRANAVFAVMVPPPDVTAGTAGTADVAPCNDVPKGTVFTPKRPVAPSGAPNPNDGGPVVGGGRPNGIGALGGSVNKLVVEAVAGFTDGEPALALILACDGAGAGAGAGVGAPLLGMLAGGDVTLPVSVNTGGEVRIAVDARVAEPGLFTLETDGEDVDTATTGAGLLVTVLDPNKLRATDVLKGNAAAAELAAADDTDGCDDGTTTDAAGAVVFAADCTADTAGGGGANGLPAGSEKMLELGPPAPLAPKMEDVLPNWMGAPKPKAGNVEAGAASAVDDDWDNGVGATLDAAGVGAASTTGAGVGTGTEETTAALSNTLKS